MAPTVQHHLNLNGHAICEAVKFNTLVRLELHLTKSSNIAMLVWLMTVGHGMAVSC